MTENKAVSRYLHRVSRCMCCSRASKERLLNGLREELPEHPQVEYASLCETFGTPEEAASALMGGVGENEIRRAKRVRIAVIAAAVLVLAVIAVTCGAYAYDKYMKYGRPGTTVVVLEPDIPVEETELTDGYVKGLSQ